MGSRPGARRPLARVARRGTAWRRRSRLRA